ncbi:MAG: type II toxin-antitoxin system RelE/ParE family toxin [Janthinobacterium lividum]
MIDDATCDADLRSPPSNHFEKLEGKLEGLHSIRVNDQWRLIFAWDGSSASQLYIDNHSYRYTALEVTEHIAAGSESSIPHSRPLA